MYNDKISEIKKYKNRLSTSFEKLRRNIARSLVAFWPIEEGGRFLDIRWADV